jgi:hypothetical protein
MHTEPMAESDGTFEEAEKTDRVCPKCGEKKVDGAYDDEKYKCECGHSWWVDGIDS